MSNEKLTPEEAQRETERMKSELVESQLAEWDEAERHVELQRGADAAVAEALALVAGRFEKNPDAKKNLAFHNTEHTKGVVSRAEAVLRKIQRGAPELVSDRDIEVGRVAASFHDVVQEEGEPNVQPEGDAKKVLRKRLTAKNEAASADAAADFARKHNEKLESEGKSVVFTEEDIAAIREAIDATIPGWDPKASTVNQPKLTAESSVIARAVALADLGEAGTDPEAYLKGGDALFREENLDVFDALKEPEKISEADKERFRKRLVGWSKFQATFAKGRKALFDKEVEGLPEAAQGELRKYFSRFDESVQEAADKGSFRDGLTFEELVVDAGYFPEGEAPSSVLESLHKKKLDWSRKLEEEERKAV